MTEVSESGPEATSSPHLLAYTTGSNLHLSGLALLERSSVALLLLNRQATIIYATPAVTNFLGPTTLIDTSLWSLVDSESVAPLQHKWDMVEKANTGYNLQHNCLIRKQNGDMRWSILHLTNALDDPQVGGIILTLADRHQHHQIKQRRYSTKVRSYKQNLHINPNEQPQTDFEQKSLGQSTYQHLLDAAKRIRQLEAILGAINDGILVYDQTGHIQQTNATARLLLGLTAESSYISLAPDERARHIELLTTAGELLPVEKWPSQRVLAGTTISGTDRLDIQIRGLDGRKTMVNVSGTPIRDAQGTITSAVLVLREITQRLLLEQQVAQQAQTLETIFTAITDAVTVFDAQGRLVQWNPEAQRLLARYLPSEALVLPLELPQYTSPTQAQEGCEHIFPTQRLLQGEVLSGESGHEVLIQTHESEELILHVTGAPLRSENGQISGAVAVTRDLTVQQRHTLRTRAALHALVTMAEVLVTVLPPMEQEAKHLLTPQVAQQFLELACQVLQCHNATFISRSPETDMAHVISCTGLSPQEVAIIQKNAEGVRFSDYYTDSAFLARLHAGEVILLDMTSPSQKRRPLPRLVQALVVPILLRGGLLGVISLNRLDEAQEYTTADQALAEGTGRLAGLLIEREHLLMETALAQANELAIRTVSQIKDEFIGIAGHELRTPLTTMKISVQQSRRILARLQTNADQTIKQELSQLEHLLARAELQMNRQNRLIRDLLDVSRIEQGHLELHLKDSDMTEIVREAVEDQRQITPTRQIKLDIPAHSIVVRADRDRVHQVLSNYLSNALKYSPNTSPVMVHLFVKNTAIQVEVTDQGYGLSEAEQQRVWERFYRVPEVQVQSGSGIGLGLGLHICKKLIEQHGGTVGVRSTVGTGSTFWFALPIE